MPMFTRRKDDVLVLTADGDYTPGELARVCANSLEAHGNPEAGPVLFDLSGAAGLEGKSRDSLAAEGTTLAAHGDRIARLAVVVSTRHADLFAPDGPFALAVGLPTRTFHSHRDATAWLLQDRDG